MFGKNNVTKPVHEGGEILRVIRCWSTIQGEGPLAGEPAIFIRLAGCNLRCWFCDTDFENGAQEKTIEDIVAEVDFLANEVIDVVVISGGEPLAQPIVPLISLLAQAGYLVQIETAGTVWQEGLDQLAMDEKVLIVCSPKTHYVHPKIIECCEHFKYIIRCGEVSEKDGLPVFSTQEQGKMAKLWRPEFAGLDTGKDGVIVWVQPCDEYLKTAVIVGTIEELTKQPERSLIRDVKAFSDNIKQTVAVAMKHNYRVSFQLHKELGVE